MRNEEVHSNERPFQTQTALSSSPSTSCTPRATGDRIFVASGSTRSASGKAFSPTHKYGWTCFIIKCAVLLCLCVCDDERPFARMWSISMRTEHALARLRVARRRESVRTHAQENGRYCGESTVLRRTYARRERTGLSSARWLYLSNICVLIYILRCTMLSVDIQMYVPCIHTFM